MLGIPPALQAADAHQGVGGKTQQRLSGQCHPTDQLRLTEQGHADQLAARIVQLGGEPDFAPDSLTRRSHAHYVAGETLLDMIKENLVAERITTDSYRGLIRHLGDQDPTTSQMLKSILAVEEKHADELTDLLNDLPNQS